MKVASTVSRLPVVLAAVSIALVVLDGGVYLGLIYAQDDDGPTWWFVAGLIVAIALAVGTIRRAGPGAVVMAIVSVIILLVLGALGILSVGLPLLLAGIMMMVVAALRLRTRSAPVSTAR
ncbi:hypothetical protein [Microlunatus soli]|uniref:Uncharacterized protein n=1 Tax=Microlunatus soli TaxID=630515 RepID=A0A1H1QB61_9ACTN|nr:hypothetical protein [Microlunatus soli]SDS20748.1 hypothetical protein SAMN04489812_1210 [Microlunatus soli]